MSVLVVRAMQFLRCSWCERRDVEGDAIADAVGFSVVAKTRGRQGYHMSIARAQSLSRKASQIGLILAM